MTDATPPVEEAPRDLDAERRAYDEGRWCGECRYGVIENPPCCARPVSGDTEGLRAEFTAVLRAAREEHATDVSNTHYAVIHFSGDPAGEHPDPDLNGSAPSLVLIASGPERFCWDALTEWTTAHPLRLWETAEVLARDLSAVREPVTAEDLLAVVQPLLARPVSGDTEGLLSALRWFHAAHSAMNATRNAVMNDLADLINDWSVTEPDDDRGGDR